MRGESDLIGPLDDGASLRLVGLSVSVDGSKIVDRVELSVAAGEVVAVLGASGSGKTTLLRAVAGLVPHEGSVVLDGVDVSRVPPHRRGVGLMFQDNALFPHRDVAGNVGFGLRMAGLERAEVDAAVTALLGLVDLGGFEHRSIAGLSGGEQQRVALARALAPRPRVLLLDEPLAALDRSLRTRLGEDIATLLRALAITALVVTHDHEEAAALADRTVVMDSGRLLGAEATRTG